MGRTISYSEYFAEKLAEKLTSCTYREEELKTKIKNNKCPNCGANLRKHTCDYCGTYHVNIR